MKQKAAGSCAQTLLWPGGGGQREDDKVPRPVCDESHPNNISDNFLHVTPAGDASHADLGTPWKDRQTRRAGEREEGRRRGGEGRGDVLDWRMFLESWCNYWVSFQCDRSHDKNDNNARPPSEFSECAPLFMLMTQLPMLGWLCSQAWNKLRGGCRQHFHCIPPVAVPITTASPILSPPTADQMLMAHAALRWLTIISLASTAHINRVTVGTGRMKCYQSHSCRSSAHGGVGNLLWRRRCATPLQIRTWRSLTEVIFKRHARDMRRVLFSHYWELFAFFPHGRGTCWFLKSQCQCWDSGSLTLSFFKAKIAEFLFQSGLKKPLEPIWDTRTKIQIIT